MNPVVAEAKVTVPRSWSAKLGHWVKEHQRTVYLTIGGLTALYALWLGRKYRLKAAQKGFDEMLEKGLNARSASIAKNSMNALKINQAAGTIKTEQRILKKVLKSQEHRLRAVERAFTSKDFHRFLKSRGIVNLKRVKTHG
jgi:maltooligosyltrehalose synthase